MCAEKKGSGPFLGQLKMGKKLGKLGEEGLGWEALCDIQVARRCQCETHTHLFFFSSDTLDSAETSFLLASIKKYIVAGKNSKDAWAVNTLQKYTLEIKVWKLLVIAFRKYMTFRGLQTLCYGTEKRTNWRTDQPINWPGKVYASKNYQHSHVSKLQQRNVNVESRLFLKLASPTRAISPIDNPCISEDFHHLWLLAKHATYF